MISALGTIVTLLFIFIQIKGARNTSAFEYVRDENDRFESQEVRSARSRLARHLLMHASQFDRFENEADEVLGYFEDFGLLVENGLTTVDYVWNEKGYWIVRYWAALQAYIKWARVEYDDPTYFDMFERLHDKIVRQELVERDAKTAAKKGDVNRSERDSEGKENRVLHLTGNEIREFLQDELQLQVDLMIPKDLERITEVEKFCFEPGTAYPASTFEKGCRNDQCTILVARVGGEIVGYVMGYARNGKGEVDSLAVEPGYRGLGVGRRLCETLIDAFRAEGVHECVLEVASSNGRAISLYKRVGFGVIKSLPGYYGDGGDGYLMGKGP
jgi:ribosomal-protein-alanine N-acetyltransferase